MAVFPRTTLPFDIVTNIMHLSSPASVAAVMGTCRFLYGHGPKQLLCRGVTLRAPRQIASFAAFMSAEGTARFRHLRELDLEVGSLECRALIVDECSVAVDALLGVLRCPALALHTLRLGRAEGLLESSHAIRTALRALTTIKHLTLCDVGPATVSTVTKMASKLVSVTICDIDLAAASDQVLAMLFPFSETLEEVALVLDGLELCNFAGTSTDICLPRVRSLMVLSDSCRFLPSCVHAFPNVQTIQHNPSSRPHSSMICQANIHTFVECVDVAARRWLNTGFRLSALTECSSDLLTLCVLRPALAAGVQKLRISTQVHDQMALVLVADVLAAARPAELEMCIAGLEVLEGVVALLTVHSLHTLRALRVDFAFAEGDHDRCRDASLAVALVSLSLPAGYEDARK